MKNRLPEIIKANYRQILLVFFAFLIMVFVSYYYASNIVRGQMETIGQEMMKTSQTFVTGSLSETELVFENTASVVREMVAAGQTNSQILSYLTETNDRYANEFSSLTDFQKVYAYVRGSFLDGSGWMPPEDYYAPSRPWYIGAVQNHGEMFFSDPYVDADTGGMCISFSMALLNAEGGVSGVIAIDLNLTRITEYVSGQRIANGGYGLLLSDSMQIVTHKNEALIGLSMSEAGSEYERLSKLLVYDGNLSAVRFTDIDGTDSVAFFTPVLDGWYIGSITPWSSYYSLVYEMGLVIGFIGLALMILLSSLLVRSRMAKLRADEESKSKSNFLARMSHEMRTPMNAIIGMTEIARSTDDPEKIQYSLRRISDAAEHLLGVINDVLDMSKIAADKLELSVTDFSVQELIHKVKNLMEQRFGDKNQNFTVAVSSEVPAALVTDEQRLIQVIINLLSNANKFTPEGGNISLSFDCPEKRGDHCIIVIAVKDDGIGMTEAQVSKLFRSFEQADNSISRRFGGTGLGLVISKNIAELMNGYITVESEPDKGAAFTVCIHAGIGKAGETAWEQPEKKDGTNAFPGRVILLAEDVEVNREIVLTLLEPTGVIIDCAENGRAAVELFRASPERYDLIFMDIHMPEMDGYEAARRIRAMDIPQAKSVPIVAMTADVFREDVERSEAVGMNGHVGKPIDINEVIGVMERFMG